VYITENDTRVPGRHFEPKPNGDAIRGTGGIFWVRDRRRWDMVKVGTLQRCARQLACAGKCSTELLPRSRAKIRGRAGGHGATTEETKERKIRPSRRPRSSGKPPGAMHEALSHTVRPAARRLRGQAEARGSPEADRRTGDRDRGLRLGATGDRTRGTSGLKGGGPNHLERPEAKIDSRPVAQEPSGRDAEG